MHTDAEKDPSSADGALICPAAEGSRCRQAVRTRTRNLCHVADELHFRGSWPASTIGGEPAIQELSMTVDRDDDGSAMFTGMIGDPDSRPEDCEHFQFLLDPDQVKELSAFFASSR